MYSSRASPIYPCNNTFLFNQPPHETYYCTEELGSISSSDWVTSSTNVLEVISSNGWSRIRTTAARSCAPVRTTCSSSRFEEALRFSWNVSFISTASWANHLPILILLAGPKVQVASWLQPTCEIVPVELLSFGLFLAGRASHCTEGNIQLISNFLRLIFKDRWWCATHFSCIHAWLGGR